MKLDFSKLTPTNRAVESLRELIQLTVFQDENIENIVTMMGGINTGDKLGFIGDMDDVGKVGAGCNPTYVTPNIASAQKVWELGDWQIPLKLCYTDLENTIAQYCLKTGTDIGDITSSEYMDVIVLPKLQEAMKKMLWRISWYGDKSATGLSAGVDADLFKSCDGIWKKLFAIGAASAGQKTAIAANSETTTASQKSKIREKGVATDLFDQLRADADSRISDLPGAGIFCTSSLADALAFDAKKTYGTIMPWEKLFDGIEVSMWDSTPVYKMSIFDRFTNKYQNNGTKINLPHRAVFTSPKNLLVGTQGQNPISELDIWFEKKERMNYMYSTGKLGTLIVEDDLVQVAY